MGNFWLKIKVWTKGIIIGALVIYALLFILNNSGQSAKLWYWFSHTQEIPMLLLVVVTFFAGVAGTVLVRTTFTTLRQVGELRSKNRIDRLEREHAEMKAKAARLRTATSVSSAPAPAAPSHTEPPIEP
jgi:hypothetical protein